MNPSLLKRKLASGDTVLTAKVCYQDPELVELMASSGVDGIWICLEHKRIAPDTLYAMIQACRLGGAEAIIRVKPSNYTDLLYMLEAGARGIMLPRVRHPDEVREVIARRSTRRKAVAAMMGFMSRLTSELNSRGRLFRAGQP